MGKSFYMHTINGKPGQYTPGFQIQYAGRSRVRLATSLQQIREEQILSTSWRANRGLFGKHTYGYVLVMPPTTEEKDDA